MSGRSYVPTLGTQMETLYLHVFLNRRKGKNGHRNNFIINLHKNVVAGLRHKLVTPASAVRCASEPESGRADWKLS